MFEQNADLTGGERETPAGKASETVSAPPVELTGQGISGISVIGNDLTIKGQQITIISKGALRVDGEVLGDVQGVELIVSKQARIVGTVAAETVSILGQVVGAIHGVNVHLHASAHVEGDICHGSLCIEEGAIFNGSSQKQRPASPELQRGEPAAQSGAKTATLPAPV